MKSGTGGDIAIIGMSAMFADAPDLRAYWHNILAGRDAVRDASESWSGPYYDPQSTDNSRIYTRKGGFIGGEIEFDPAEFGVMPKSVSCADADHFLALRVSRDALRDAGYEDRPFDRQRTGVILGRGTYVNRGYNTLLQHGQTVDQILSLLSSLHEGLSDGVLNSLRTRLKETLPPFTGDSVPNLVPNVIAGRIANRLNLMGPNYIVDAACASSLVAVELAAAELQYGRCDMVLSGGVHSATPPQLYMMFCQLNALSRRELRPFDASADGTLLGEGLGIVVLKRLGDAERDGDRIYAVIKGVGTSSDGRALGLLAPNSDGQILALQRAYARSGIEPGTVELIEAHGTGMPAGDRTEIQTLRAVFGDRSPDGTPQCAIGSVKSMIGHCIPAAGVAGMIKAALALHDKVLPPTLCGEVNPELQIGDTSLYVNTATRPWIHGRSNPRRAGVNAFGFGGVNAHAVLEEYIPAAPSSFRTFHSQWPAELFLFAASNRRLLAERLKAALKSIDGRRAPIADIACAMSEPPVGAHRLAVVCAGLTELKDKLENAVKALESGESPRPSRRQGWYYGETDDRERGQKTAILFPGEGGQHLNMLSELCVHLPSVALWFDRLETSLSGLAQSSPKDSVFPPPTSMSAAELRRLEERLNSLEIGSAVVFIASMALFELLSKLGVRCDAMVGHSTGEGAALVASGIVRISGEEQLLSALTLFNRTYREMIGTGRMPRGVLLTVGAADKARIEQIVAAAGGKLHVALENCPNQTVLFGGAEEAGRAADALRAAGAIAVPLPFDRACHTPLLAPAEPGLRRLYDSLDVGQGHTPVYSCCTAEPFPADPMEIRRLATAQWFSPVRFQSTIERLHERGFRRFIEVGPGSNLTGFVRDILHGRDHAALSVNVPGRCSLTQVLTVLGQLFVRGADLDLEPLFSCRQVNRSSHAAAPHDGSRVARQVRLDLNMPVMQFSGDVLEDVRRAVRSGAGVGSDFRSAPGPAGLHADSRSDPKLAGLFGHFELMRRFLESQAHCVSRAIGKSGEPGHTTTPDGPQGDPVKASGLDRWPLLGTLLERDADRLLCERRFDLRKDAFLRDHTLGSPCSARQPDLHGLAVVPFTVSMEIVAEAAHCLAEGRLRVVRLLDLRGYQWLALDEEQLTLQISAAYVPESDRSEVRVQLHQVRPAGPASDSLLVFEGHVVLAGDFPQSPEPLAFELPGARSPHYQRAMLYGLAPDKRTRYAPLFHGPVFHGVERIERWGNTGIHARLTAGDPADFRSNASQAKLQTDPVLLDAAGQLIGYWVAERFGVDLSFFPFAVRELQQFGEPPAAGAPVFCQARIRIVAEGASPGGFEFLSRSGRTLLRVDLNTASPVRLPVYETCRIYPPNARLEADFEFTDAGGSPIARLRGWQDRYFSIPHRYYRCRLRPDREYLSYIWLEDEFGSLCRRFDMELMPYLDEGWGIWKRVLAHLMLSRRERAIWNGLPATGKRRTEWLLGRIAAKDAVRSWMHERGYSPAPADIEILPGRMGQPEVHCVSEGQEDTPVVSITHSSGRIVAIAGDPSLRVGVDLVCLKDARSPETLEKAFSEDERKLLDRLPRGRRMSIAALWAAREAAAKAAGTGLEGRPGDWVIADCSPDATGVHVLHRSESAPVRLWFGRDEVLAVCRKPAAESARVELPA